MDRKPKTTRTYASSAARTPGDQLDPMPPNGQDAATSFTKGAPTASGPLRAVKPDAPAVARPTGGGGEDHRS
eukprot:899882-Alexandrium_andersonii.AAC.1